MKKISNLFYDLLGFYRICGSKFATKYLFYLILNIFKVFKRGDLIVIDRLMGIGPFKIKFKKNIHFKIQGFGSVSGIRELYIRDVYLRNGKIKISDGSLILDLGANMGNFTNLALSHGSGINVIAVEPNLTLNQQFYSSLSLNSNFLERAKLFRAFIGVPNIEIQKELTKNPDYFDVPFVDENFILQQTNSRFVNLLKCDIEGGEFSLFNTESKLLKTTHYFVGEIHAFAGDVKAFLSILERNSFEIIHTDWAPDGSCTVLAKNKYFQNI
jgi:FkbM family methyltransferase